MMWLTESKLNGQNRLDKLRIGLSYLGNSDLGTRNDGLCAIGSALVKGIIYRMNSFKENCRG